MDHMEYICTIFNSYIYISFHINPMVDSLSKCPFMYIFFVLYFSFSMIINDHLIYSDQILLSSSMLFFCCYVYIES
jgi:hypothetical protein